MAPDLVSVILPVYNGETFLEETIESVLTQSHNNLELIVVDDGSTDRSYAIARNSAARDPRVKLFQQANGGVAAARNAAIGRSNGQFVAPIDADDLWHPRKLERQLAAFSSSNHRVGLVYSPSIDIDENSRPLSLCHSTKRPEGIVWLQLFVNNFTVNASTPLIRAACLEKIGGYDESFFHANAYGAEDWDLCLRIACFYEFRCMPECLVGYRRLFGSMSGNTIRMKHSYDLVVQKISRLGWPIKPRFKRYSESTISRYLASQSARSGNLSDVFHWCGLALQRDPLCLVDRSLYLTIRRAVVRNIRRRWPSACTADRWGNLTWIEAAEAVNSTEFRRNRLWKNIQNRRIQTAIGIQRSTAFPLQSAEPPAHPQNVYS
jgi:glycosyltransferase involved in cell wall biosynthesis